MSADYLVIYENFEPHEEYTTWHLVPKCGSPEMAVQIAEVPKRPTTLASDERITVFELLGDYAERVFTPSAVGRGRTWRLADA